MTLSLKKTFWSLFLLVFCFVFLSPITTATPLVCPTEEFSYEDELTNETKTIENIKSCQGEEFKNIVSGIFLAERERVAAIINQTYQDQQNNPETVSALAIRNLREANTCYRNLCNQIVNHCKSLAHDATQRAAIERRNECQRNNISFSETHELEFLMSVNHNAERKSQSLPREKFRAMEGNMRIFIVNVFNRIVNNLKEFEGKITNFIVNPV